MLFHVQVTMGKTNMYEPDPVLILFILHFYIPISSISKNILHKRKNLEAFAIVADKACEKDNYCNVCDASVVGG